MNYSSLYLAELTDQIIPFWQKHSIDMVNGGFFTCIDEQHQVFDTDKFIWLQCRQVWMFGTFYENIKPNKEWLDIAENGADFLLKKGHDGNFNWYFSLDQQGNPTIEPYNIFSYTFACLAFSKMFTITKNEKYKEAFEKTFEQIEKRKNNPKGKWNKSISKNRPLKNFALPMILCNLYTEVGTLIPLDIKKQNIELCVFEILNHFWINDKKVLVENTTLEGNYSDTFEGRLVNPGHGLEAFWFIMDLGVNYQRKDWINESVDKALLLIEKGWDSLYGGIFYFLDTEGHPPQQLEWDQKLWWVHLEAMICFLKGFELTQKNECLDWFKRIHDYTWNHFRDHINKGEWYGYLNRRGEVLLPLKGGKWKGCFHVPRALLNLHEIALRMSI